MLDISVVVCTLNRAAQLGQAVESLMAQETDGRFAFEVVVVDNGSTDDTVAVVGALAASASVPVRLVREPVQGVAIARNRGLAESAGTWIAFFDDDQVADRRWLAELYATALARDVRCVGGAVELLLPPGISRCLAPVCRRVLGATAGIAAPCRYTRKMMPGTGNVMIHRSVFDEVGAFDAALAQAGEDVDLFRRMRAAGIAAWYTPGAIVHHVIPPHRLQDDYFRWTSLRVGACFAHRDWSEHGRLYLLAVLVARLAQAALLHLPHLAGARLRGDAEAALGRRCLLWRLQGFARYAIHVALPAWSGQSAFLAQINFRQERRLFRSP